MSAETTYSSVVTNRGFRFLWINQILVQLAYNSINFALIIWVFKLVNTNLAVSALMLCIYLPSVIFGVFSGVLADTLDKRKIILSIDFLLALSFLALIFVKRSFPLVLLDTFVANSLAQFFMPAESSSIPLLVNRKQLFLANSLFSLTLYGALMVGYSIGGPILNSFGFNAICFLGALMLCTAYALAQNLPQIKAAEGYQQIKLFTIKGMKWVFKLTAKETKETITYIKRRVPVSAAIWLLAGVQGIVGVLAVIMPSYMERVLHIHATDASYIVMLPLGLGMVTGAFSVGKFFHNRPRRSLVIPAIFGCSAIFLMGGIMPLLTRLIQWPGFTNQMYHLSGFALVPSLSSFFALLAYLLGFFTVSIIIPCQTVLQEQTPDHDRGKIFAMLAIMMTGFSAIPVFLAGVIADIFGIIPIFIGLGIITLIIGLVAFRPDLFFEEDHLPFKVREFLGLGHWVG